MEFSLLKNNVIASNNFIVILAYFFILIGKNLMNNITGEMVMDKYNMKPGIKLKQKLHEERVNYLKSQL